MHSFKQRQSIGARSQITKMSACVYLCRYLIGTNTNDEI